MSLSLPIEIIPGIELSAGFGKGDIHILGYYINPECKSLKKLLNSWLTNVYGVMKKWQRNLNEAGIDITVDKLYDGDPDKVLTRAHFAGYLVDNGYVKDKAECFKKYLRRRHSLLCIKTISVTGRMYRTYIKSRRISCSGTSIPVQAFNARPYRANRKIKKSRTVRNRSIILYLYTHGRGPCKIPCTQI